MPCDNNLNGGPGLCTDVYNCCSCGDAGCGCAYCFDCNACDSCKEGED